MHFECLTRKAVLSISSNTGLDVFSTMFEIVTVLKQAKITRYSYKLFQIKFKRKSKRCSAKKGQTLNLLRSLLPVEKTLFVKK